MSRLHTVNVRALAEFILLRGDLMPASAAMARMNEGTIGHKRLQSMLGAEWQCELAMSYTETVGGITLKVQGRADAVRVSDGSLTVLEIKTTRKRPDTISADRYPEHLEQGILYAYILCETQGFDRANVDLCYYNLDGRQHTHHRHYSRGELRAEFERCAKPYAAWIAALDEWKSRSAPTLTEMRFPFDSPRDGQTEMSAQVFAAMKQHTNALIEAPTGIGKTAASLYGALKVLGTGEITALFYLTARTTGRRAAEQALDLLRTQGVLLRSVTITAKEKLCPMGKPECFGCPLAAGYYERRRDALNEALIYDHIGEAEALELAREHAICPYELTLDASEQADVIICDYNYVFDPRVHLRRYFDRKSKAGLLIDEAHNLPDRASAMYSAELSGARILSVLRDVVKAEGKESPAALALTELLTAFRSEKDAEPESLSEPREGYAKAAQTFADRMEELRPGERAVSELMLDAAWFAKTAARFDETCCRMLVLPEGKTSLVRLWCWNASGYIRKTLKRVGGTAMFSATLAPIDHYARMLGLDPNGADSVLKLASPFPPENQLTLRLPLSVTYADRGETLYAVTAVIHAMAAAKPGNYLACFPSFQYMEQAFQLYRGRWPDEPVVCQQRHMSEQARTAFIESFRPAPKRSMAAFIVLGGVFAEGVDLPDDRLSGAAIVSTGMPQLSYEGGLLAELFDDGYGTGADVAYTYPGMRRVLQAAGRVIRTPTDRGVVLLIDKRYQSEQIRALMPEHWRVKKVPGMAALKAALEKFWGRG